MHLARGRRPDRLPQLVGLGVLEKVADRPGANCAGDGGVLQNAGQGDHLHVRHLGPDRPRRRDPTHARHQEIHEDHLRMKFPRQPDRLLAGRGLADDLEFGVQRQKHAQTLSDHAMVVGDQQPYPTHRCAPSWQDHPPLG